MSGYESGSGESYKTAYGTDDFIELAATGTDYTVLDVSSGTEFFLRDITIYNSGTGTAAVTIYKATGGAAANIKTIISIGTTETGIATYDVGLKFDGDTDDVIARVDTVVGGSVFISCDGVQV